MAGCVNRNDQEVGKGRRISCVAGLRAIRLCPLLLLFLTSIAVQAGTAGAGEAVWTGNGPYGQSVGVLAVSPASPQTIFAGTNGGGLFRSANGGSSWTAVNSGIRNTFVLAVVVDPSNAQIVYAGGGQFLYKSTNGGDSWSALNFQISGSVWKIVIDPSSTQTLYAATWPEGVYKSVNGGATWTQVNTGLTSTNVRTLALDSSSPQTLYAGTNGGGVFKSTNGGTSWTPANSGLGRMDINSLAVNPANPQVIYAGTSGGGVFKSATGGASWTEGNAGLTTGLYAGNFVNALVTDPSNSETILAGTSSGVFKSTDGGVSWGFFSVGLDNAIVQDLLIAPGSPQTIFAGTWGVGVFKSTDGGNSWTASRPGLASSIWKVVVDPINAQTIYAGTSGAGAFKSTDGGNSWTAINAGLSYNVNAIAIDPSSPQTLYGGTLQGISISRDGGGSWTESNAGLTDAPKPGNFVYAVALDPSNRQTLYAGTQGGGVFKSTNGGNTWTPINSGLPDNTVQCIGIDPSVPQTLYVGTGSGGVFKSTNGGVSWSAANSGIPASYVPALAIDPQNPQTVYAAGGGSGTGGMFKTTNGGGSWFAINSGLSNTGVQDIAIDPKNPQTIYVATWGGGIFRTTNGGSSWLSYNAGLTSTLVRSVAVAPASPSNVFAGTVGGGVFAIGSASAATTAPGVITTFAGTGTRGYSGDGGPALQAQINAPQGVAADAFGNVYVADKENHRVRRIGADGIMTTFAGTGQPGFSGDAGLATQARLSSPCGVATDSAGNVYIADTGNARIRRVGRDGIIRTVAGSGQFGFSGDGGLATQAALSGPFGVAVDAAGNLYIGDDSNHRVRKVRPDGIITTVAGSGPTGGPDTGMFSGDGGPATQARLNRAIGVAVDAKGNLYVAEYNSNRVRRVSPDGIIVTYAGSGFTTGPSSDGMPATEANLFHPNGVAVDASGNVYIAEHGASRVSRVSPDGTFTTYAGTGPPNTVSIGDGGPANRATLSGPQAVAVDARGNVYIAEEWGNRIRKVTPGGAQTQPPPSQAAVIGISPLSLTFGETQTGTTSEKTLTVSNTGSGPLSITGITPIGTDASQFTASPATVTVAAGGSQTVTVTFRPTSAGQKFASLSIAHNAPGTPSLVSLTGAGVATPVPDIDLSPLGLNFGDVEARKSKPLTLKVANRGKAVLTVSGITSSNEVFKASPTTLALAPGDSATVTVTFAPTAAGAQSGSLTITSDDPDEGSVRVALNGNGTAPAAPRIDVFPALINFGAVTLGQTKSVTIEVSNVGGGTLRVANIVFSSPDFSIDATSFSVRAGEKRTLIITFSPSKAANVNETLDIPSDDPESRLTQVSIRATVRQSTAGPAIAVGVNALDFGQVDFGRGVDLNLPIRNEGTGPLNISNITSDNVQVTVTPTSLAIQAGQSRTVTVTYKPQTLRERSGNIRITSDDPAQPTVKVPWTAAEVVTGKALTVMETSPASGAVGVPLKTEVAVTFSEPVFARRGFIAVDASLFPEPASGDLLRSARVEDGGRKVVFAVELKTATFYRFVLFGATSVSGAELDKTYSFSFSTDLTKPAVGSIAGAVSLSGGTLPRTAVLLYDQKGTQVAQGVVESDGKYQLQNLGAGQYYVYAQGDLPDGRRVSGASARNPVTLTVGQSLMGIDVTMRVVDQAVSGANPTAGVSLDLDPARGNQKSASLGGVKPGQQISLSVYAEGVKDLIGYAVGVEYDTAGVAFAGVDGETGEEKNVLSSAGGTMLFIKQPPKGNAVSIGGALLSPTSATAPDGGGLLGILRFTALEGFSSGSEFRVPRVVFRGLSGRDTVEVNAQASISTQVRPPPSAGPLKPKAGDGTGTLGVKDEKTQALGGVKPGQQVEVFVTLGQEIAGANAFQVAVTFDPKQLKVASGKLAGVFASAISPGPPQVKDSAATYGGAFLGSTVAAKGTLAVITFEALGDFSGETEVVLTGLSVRVSGQSRDFKPGASVVLNSGAVSGGPPSPDFDGDGDVGFNDFFLFAGGFGQKAEGENAKFDLDGDGDVSFGDFFLFAGAFGQKAGKSSAMGRTVFFK